MTDSYLLQIKGVTKDYAQHRALDQVSLNVPEGCIFGLLGPNGAGKTSLIRIINQITGADSGEILFRNEPLQPSHIYQIGYLPEERGLYKKMPIGEQLLYFARLKGLSTSDAQREIKFWFERLDIMHWLKKNITELSKGMQQKVQFVATVLHKPSLIILDEPFTGFDPLNADIIKNEIIRLKAEGATIIFSTHRMEQVEEMCDFIGLINKSRLIIDGSVEAVQQRYSRPSFLVESNSSLSSDEQFEVHQLEPVSRGLERYEVKPPQGTRPNEVLRWLSSRTEVYSFQPQKTSIHEIFVNLVAESTQ